MCRYQLSPHVYLESFDEDAVLLIADQDYMITVNHAGAQLFKQAQAIFEEQQKEYLIKFQRHAGIYEKTRLVHKIDKVWLKKCLVE